MVVLCAGMFMALLDTTIVYIAIPSIIDGIGASPDEEAFTYGFVDAIHPTLALHSVVVLLAAVNAWTGADS